MKLKRTIEAEKAFGFSFGEERKLATEGNRYFLKKPQNAEEARKEGSRLCDFMRKNKLEKAFIDLEELSPDLQYAFLEGALLADYSFEKYKKEGREEITLFVKTTSDTDKLEKVKELVFSVRDLINEPPGRLTPSSFARRAEKLKSSEIELFDEKKMKEMGLEGTLAVSKGSCEPPVFLRFHYKPSNPKGKIALIGKGVTFDSGGINLKPSSSLKGMHMDMAGAGIILGIFQALEVFKSPYEITGYVPLAENMPSGEALKPGDIIKFRNGKTVEIMNTDAEGRLLLADALILASEEKPDYIIDFATLTGAAIVALGEICAALFSNDDELKKKLLKASSQTGELLWEMPLLEDYREDIKSKKADLKNADYGKGGSTIKAALFLSEFVEGKWAHLDIAGPAILSKKHFYMPEGATAFGFRLTAKLLEMF